MAQLIQGSPSIHEALIGSQLCVNGMVAYAYHTSTTKIETGGSEVQHHPQLRHEVEASLGYYHFNQL